METSKQSTTTFGSEALDKIVKRLKGTSDPRKRYEYLLWLAKKLPSMPEELQTDSNKVRGCISKVYVLGEIIQGRILWKGDSDALITKGLLSLLIVGLNNLTAQQVLAIDPAFIAETGLQVSLTPSRANGFMNILFHMKAQAKKLSEGDYPVAQ